MLFDIPFIADWKKILGDYRQRQTDLNIMRENEKRIDYDYKVGGKKKKLILIYFLQHVVLHNSHSFEGTSFFSTCISLQIEQRPEP